MNIFYHARKAIVVLALLLVLTFTTACGSSSTQTQTPNPAKISQSAEYSQLARGNSAAGQDFGNWVIQTSKGLIKDAYVRDGNKLGVVISPQVQPTEVKALAQSLAQGFRHNFPKQDLTILLYAPDKKLILTARYDNQSRQIDYQQAS
jgi:predicted metallo-beta-lactamase superfamily hydrolase